MLIIHMIVLITLIVMHKHMVGPTSSKVNLEHVSRERLTITMNGLDDPYVGPWWSSHIPKK